MRWVVLIFLVATGLYSLTLLATRKRWKREDRSRAALPAIVADVGLTFEESDPTRPMHRHPAPLNRGEWQAQQEAADENLDAASRASVYVLHIRSQQYFGQDDGDGQIAGTYRATPILGSVYWSDMDGVLGSVLLLATPVPSQPQATIVVTHPGRLKELADLTSLNALPLAEPGSAHRIGAASDDMEEARVVLDSDFRRFLRGMVRSKEAPEGPRWFEIHAGYALIQCGLPGSAEEFRQQLDALIEFRAHLLRRSR